MKSKSAFTLVELAIVIVIIGLLVGGVLTGQELIRQAQIRNFIKLTQTLITAKNTFYSKYNAIPGDLRNATIFFDQTKCEALLYTGVACNSDQSNGGNGLIDGGWAVADSDPMRFWVHLYMAKIFNATPYNNHTDISFHMVPVVANKALTVAGNSTFWNSRIRPGASTAQQNLAGGNYFSFFNWNTTWDGSVASAPDTYNIDSKLDDGLPLSGKFLAGTGSSNSIEECIVGTAYNIASDAITCNLFFQMD